MTHRVRHAFGRVLASGLASAFALLVAASSLAAQQATGKLEGSVTDQQGAPIANAQVTIVGTAFGALTDAKGYYFMNNVPVGTYTVRARFIGYTPAEVPGVRGAEFGDAQSCVLSYVTRAGGQRYTGALSYQSDDIGSLWRNVGYNRVEGSIGGPIKGNLTFFVAATLTGQKSLESEADRDLDRPIFVASGVDPTVHQPSTVR